MIATALVSNRSHFCKISSERIGLLAQQNWIVSQNRILRWNELLSVAIKKQRVGEIRTSESIAETMRLVEEVLLSQLFARIWAALLTVHDQKNQVEKSERQQDIGKQIVNSHSESANRAMELLKSLLPSNHPRAEIVNRLRRRTERWTDMLIAQMAENVDLFFYAFDENRVRDIIAVNSRAKDRPTVGMLIGGVQAAQIECSRIGYSPRRNEQLACVALGCLPSDSWPESEIKTDLSVLRTDQFAWEIDMLVQQALCTDHSVEGVF